MAFGVVGRSGDEQGSLRIFPKGVHELFLSDAFFPLMGGLFLKAFYKRRGFFV